MEREKESSSTLPDCATGSDYRERMRIAAGTAGKWVRRAVVGGVGFSIALSSQMATTHDEIGPARVEAHLTIGDGEISGEVPLVGPATFEPSLGPFGMDFALKEIPDLDVQSLQSEFRDFEPDKFEKDAFKDLQKLSTEAAVKGGLIGIIGGAAAIAGSEALLDVARRRGLKRVSKMGAIGLATTTSLAIAGAGLTWQTFEEENLRKPTYSNSLEEVMSFVNGTIFSIDRYKQTSEQATEWLNNMLATANNAEEIPLPGSDLVPILAVSDIHGRPCTLERMKLIIDRLNIEMVIDAGDMSEWDQPQTEAALFDADCSMRLKNYGELGVPVYTVLGNHDGSDTLRTVTNPNVTVLSGKPVVVSTGETTLEIIGDSDPVKTVNPGTRLSKEEEYRLICDLGDTLGSSARMHQTDITVVHSPIVAERVRRILGEDDSSWIIAGHSHKFKIDQQKRIITLGTAGGAGFRTFEKQPDNERVTMQFQVLYLDATTKQVSAVVRLMVQNNGFATSQIEVLDGENNQGNNAMPPVSKAG